MRASTWTRLAALGVWGVASACAALWGYRLLVQAAPVPAHAASTSTAQTLRGDPVLLLGATPDEPSEASEEPLAVAASRFQLLGVVAPRSPSAAREGLALIAVDGKPARAYRVGTPVEGELVLQTVRARGADLGARGGPTAVALSLGALPGPATGVPGRPPTPAQPGAVSGGAAPGMTGAQGAPAVPTFSNAGRPGTPAPARPLVPARAADSDDDDGGPGGGESDHAPGETSPRTPAQRQLLSTH